MFEDIHNTGADHCCASSGLPPSQAIPYHNLPFLFRMKMKPVMKIVSWRRSHLQVGEGREAKGLIITKERNRRQLQVIGFMNRCTRLWK
jgi:hypothetical protein